MSACVRWRALMAASGRSIEAPLPWQPSDGCTGGGGAGKMEVRKPEMRRRRRVIWGVAWVIYNSKYLQMQHISSRCRTWDNISMHVKAFHWTGHLCNKIKVLCDEFSKPISCDLWWFVPCMKQTDDNSPFESDLENQNACQSKIDNSIYTHRK